MDRSTLIELLASGKGAGLIYVFDGREHGARLEFERQDRSCHAFQGRNEVNIHALYDVRSLVQIRPGLDHDGEGAHARCFNTISNYSTRRIWS